MIDQYDRSHKDGRLSFLEFQGVSDPKDWVEMMIMVAKRETGGAEVELGRVVDWLSGRGLRANQIGY